MNIKSNYLTKSSWLAKLQGAFSKNVKGDSNGNKYLANLSVPLQNMGGLLMSTFCKEIATYRRQAKAIYALTCWNA